MQARGIVLGRVGYMGKARISLTAESFEKTGREESVRVLSIAGWNVPLSAGTAFSQSILVKQSEEMIVGNVLPARVITRTYAEIKPVSRTQSYAEAEAAGIVYAKADAQSKMPINSMQTRQTIYSELTEDGFVEVRVYLTALAPIGMENKQMMTDPLLYIPKYW